MSTTPERIAEIRKLLSEITPRPWFYNSYSMVQAGPAMLEAWENGPDYPREPRPHGAAEQAWVAQRNAAYEVDIEIASVPALYGDTAVGRHAADADFIAQAPGIVEELLMALEALPKPKPS